MNVRGGLSPVMAHYPPDAERLKETQVATASGPRDSGHGMVTRWSHRDRTTQASQLSSLTIESHHRARIPHEATRVQGICRQNVDQHRQWRNMQGNRDNTARQCEVDAHHPKSSLRRACPITLGRDVARSSPSILNAGVTWKVQRDLSVLLEELPAQNLRKQISRIRLARNVANSDEPCTAKLAHLEQLSVHVARVGG